MQASNTGTPAALTCLLKKLSPGLSRWNQEFQNLRLSLNDALTSGCFLPETRDLTLKGIPAD
jgi:hypothetical protein